MSSGKALRGKIIISRFSSSKNNNKHKSLQISFTVFNPKEAKRNKAELLLLSSKVESCRLSFFNHEIPEKELKYLSTNGLGGMQHCQVNWGEFHSRYDVMLAANLNENHPEDRHVFLRRCRLYLFYNGRGREINKFTCQKFFIDQFNRSNWEFEVPVGNGKYIKLHLISRMVHQQNSIELLIKRKSLNFAEKKYLEDYKPIKIIARPDIEDRNFHYETKASMGPENTGRTRLLMITMVLNLNRKIEFLKGAVIKEYFTVQMNGVIIFSKI